MDFDLSPEHVLLRDTIRDFMLAEVAPHIDEHERARRFPRAIVDDLGRMGWLGIPIPEDEGGAGLDTLAYAIAIEEIGRVWGIARPDRRGPHQPRLRAAPSRRQRRPEGSATSSRWRRAGSSAAYGLTEPGAGSDSGGTRTTARLEDGPDGGTWVIDGGKRFITNAGQAGTYIVTARTRDPRRRFAPRSAPSSSRPTRPASRSAGSRRSSGLHASATGELIFDGVRACRPPTCSASAATASGSFLRILDGGRISIGALAVGLAQAALDASIPYAQTRQQFGRPIGTFQGVAFMIADMATEIEAARQMVWRAAWLKDQGRDYRPRRGPGEAVRLRGQLAGDQRRRSRSTAATATSRSTRSSAICATPS